MVACGAWEVRPRTKRTSAAASFKPWRPILVGPFVPDAHAQGAEEVLPIAPSRWYLTGFLSPQGGRVPDAEDRDSTDDALAAGSETQAEDAGSDEPPPKRPVRFPASMGVSAFLPPGEGDAILVDVWYADYDKIEVALDHTDRKVTGWKRVPHGPIAVPVPLDASALHDKDGIPVPGSRGLVIRGELRTTTMEGLEPGTRVLSLFLVNDRGVTERDRDTQFVFQVRMRLTYERGFVSRPEPARRGRQRRGPARARAHLPRPQGVGRRPQHERGAPGEGGRQGDAPLDDAAPLLRGAERRAPRGRRRDARHGRPRKARRQGPRERALAPLRGVRRVD